MRITFFTMVAILAAVSCSDPDCPDTERKIGITCVPIIKRPSDGGATDMGAATNAGKTTSGNTEQHMGLDGSAAVPLAPDSDAQAASAAASPSDATQGAVRETGAVRSAEEDADAQTHVNQTDAATMQAAKPCLDDTANTCRTCSGAFLAAGTPCSGGQCDGKGNCGPAPTCGDGVVNQASEQCDDGNRIDEDDCLNHCKAAACGDGLVNRFGSDANLKEECDPKSLGASIWNCSACKKVTTYLSCASAADCSNGDACFANFNKRCSRECDPGPANSAGIVGPTSGCPTPPPPVNAYCNPGVPICTVVNCKSSADCPPGLVCKQVPSGSLFPYTSSCTDP